MYNILVLLLIKTKVMVRVETLNQKLQKIREESIKFQDNCNHAHKLFAMESNNKRLTCNTCQKALSNC